MKTKLSLIVAMLLITVLLSQMSVAIVLNPHADQYYSAYDQARTSVATACKLYDLDADGYISASVLAIQDPNYLIITDPPAMTMSEVVIACLSLLNSAGLTHQATDCTNEYCYDMYPDDYRKQNVFSALELNRMTLPQIDKCISADEDGDGFIGELSSITEEEKILCDTLIANFGVDPYYVNSVIDCNNYDKNVGGADTTSVCYPYYNGCFPAEAELDIDGDTYPRCVETEYCDSYANLYPGSTEDGSTEIPNDGIDQDCDGVDEIDSERFLELVSIDSQTFYFTAELADNVDVESLIAFYWDFGDGTGYGTNLKENSGIVGVGGAVEHTYASVSEEGFTPVFRVMDKNFVISEMESSPITISEPTCSYNEGIKEPCSLENTCTGDMYKLGDGTICCLGQCQE